MANQYAFSIPQRQQFSIKRAESTPIPGSKVLYNLLKDTSPPVLAMLSERYGLRRIPGLDKEALIERIARQFGSDDLKRLEDELVEARYGDVPIGRLIELALGDPVTKVQGRNDPALPGKARLDQISTDDAILLEAEDGRWVYTMRGHDVIVDLDQHTLACDCAFFSFASRRQVLCKHLAVAFRLLPRAYAREALIDVLVQREYGGGQDWSFEGRRAA